MVMAVLLRFICAVVVSLILLLVPHAQAYSTVSDDTIRLLQRPTPKEFDINSGGILAPILIPRLPGTENSTKVLEHFKSYFSNNLPDWTLETHTSTFTTPVSDGAKVPFVNFIASRDPPWATAGDTGRLTLVAHYDSKYTPSGFIGAIDSAAPCAMIMHAVASIDDALTKKWAAMQAEGVEQFDGVEEHKGIQVLLLDGEEAFITWTGDDSLYGARGLAEAWEEEVHPAWSTYRNKLESISLFMLLDLLGSKSPSIPSYFKTTHWAYQGLAKLEQRLRGLELFKSGPGIWFPDSEKNAHTDSVSFPSWGMQDDHIPFIARGVEVLHLIPSRFPSVWHTIDDDGEHLDMPTVEDWTVLTAAFVAEWMELEGFVEVSVSPNLSTAKQKRSQEKVISKTEL